MKPICSKAFSFDLVLHSCCIRQLLNEFSGFSGVSRKTAGLLLSTPIIGAHALDWHTSITELVRLYRTSERNLSLLHFTRNMNVSSRLAIANRIRSEQRAEREDIAADSPQASVIRGKLISSSRDGYTLQTQSGGTITIPRRTTDPQNFSPTKGAVYQASISAGIARIQASSRSKAADPQRRAAKQFIVAAGPPTIDDKGTTDTPFWVDIGTKDPAGGLFQSDLYIWSGALDGYAKVSGDGLTVIYGTGAPPNPDDPDFVTPADGQPYHDRLTDRLWHYDLRDNIWRAAGSKNFFQGVPSINPRSYVTGDRVTILISSGSTLSPCDYIWSEDLSDWILVSCCPNCPDTFSNTNCGHDQAYNGNTCSALPD